MNPIHTLSLSLLPLLLPLSLQASPMVNFETHGGHTTCATVPVSENLLATLAVFGTKADSASLTEEADSDTPTKLPTIFNNRTTSLVLLKHQTPKENLPTLGSSDHLTISSPLYLDPKDPSSLCRIVSREYFNRGDVLPLSFLRVHYSGDQIPPVGSPLYNKAGEICALVHQPAPSYGNGSYALPIEALKKFINTHESGTANARCWIGISMEAANSVPQIVSVRPDSPAAKAGLKKGDIIAKIGTRKIQNYAQAVDAFFYFIPEKKVSLNIIRGTKEKTLTIIPEISPLSKNSE